MFFPAIMSVFSLSQKLMIEMWSQGCYLAMAEYYLMYVISPPGLEAKAAIVYNYQKRREKFATLIPTLLEQNEKEESVQSIHVHIFKLFNLFFFLSCHPFIG